MDTFILDSEETSYWLCLVKEPVRSSTWFWVLLTVEPVLWLLPLAGEQIWSLVYFWAQGLVQLYRAAWTKYRRCCTPQTQNRQTLARLAKRKRGRTWISKIINERGDIITDITETWSIIRHYYEELYNTTTNWAI